MVKQLLFRHGRRLVQLHASGVALVLVVLIGWSFVLPEYRPRLRAGEVYGIDVSSHQQPLDWRRVSDDGIRFAYVKASEGSSWKDPAFDQHWDGARQAGLRTGAYHYFSLCSPGKSQAENFIKTMPKDGRMLPPVLDLEHSPFCDRQPGRELVRTEVDTFVRLVSEATGKDVLFYVGDDFDRDYGIKEHYRGTQYWQLRYLQRPGDPRDRIWQVGNFFNVEGARGRVDLNVGVIDGL